MPGSKGKRALRRGGSFLLLLLLTAAPAAAGDLRQPPAPSELHDGLKLAGKWLTLKPYARVVGVHTSNVYLQPNQLKQDDTLLLTTLGAQAEAVGLNKELTLSYAGTQQTYARFGALDTWEHRFRGQGGLRLGQLSSKATVSAARLVTPTDPRFTGRLPRWTGQGSLILEWRQTKQLSFRSVAGAEFIDFLQGGLDFFDQAGWGLAAFAAWDPGLPLTLLAGAGYRELRYTSGRATNPDYGLARASVGAEVDRGRVRGSLEVAYERGWIVRKNGNPAGTPKPEGAFLNGQVSWRPPLSKVLDSRLTLSASHNATFSAKGPFQLATTVGLKAEQELPRDLWVSARVSYELQDPRGGSNLRSFTSLLRLDWRPHPRFSVGLQGTWTDRSVLGDTDYEVFTIAAGATVTY